VSLRNNPFSPLYRWQQAFAEETNDTLPRVAMLLLLVASAGGVLTAMGFRSFGFPIFLVAGVSCGALWTWIQIRAVDRRLRAQNEPDDDDDKCADGQHTQSPNSGR
jgi:hypothetical protein